MNAALVLLYWNIGERIRRDVLREKRAEYGEMMVEALAQQLTAEFGRGFGRRNLFNMIRFVEVFPRVEIVQTLWLTPPRPAGLNPMWVSAVGPQAPFPG